MERKYHPRLIPNQKRGKMNQNVSEIPSCPPHIVSGEVERWVYGSTTFLRFPIQEEPQEFMIVNRGFTIEETNLRTGITTVDFADD